MRGLSTKFMTDLKTGMLKDFLIRVKEDDTLCLEIRNDYINIYYRGGNIIKIEPEKSEYKISFDINYCVNYKNEVSAILSNDYDRWASNIPVLKSEMDAYFHRNPKLEREFQQLVLRENNNSSIAKDTDYYISDIEYANSENHSRFDLLGIKWLSTSTSHKKADDIRLVFIEKKYGDAALVGSSGIKKHFDDLNTFMNDKNKVDNIYKETEDIFNQKIELGLIRDLKKPITISRNKPEFILLIANHKPAKSVLQREINNVIKNSSYYAKLKKVVDMKIATASYMGYGLYSEMMVDLETFKG